ncbi:MAG: N-acylneuraminate cytidylyltransferase [Nitrosomonadaceae bacterium]|nr:N-acylneuraminate cytidylyltransferase [Nitrosomonadaceae bacterium]
MPEYAAPILSDFRALITARSGSKAIKNKNLSRYQGFTLLEYSIAAARLLLPAEDVWVSTDSEEYAEIASSAGATIKFLRPAILAQDDSSDFEVFRHAIEYEGSHEPRSAVYWLHLRPTTPLRDPAELARAIGYFLNHESRPTALRSVHKSDFPVMKWCVESEFGFLTSLLGDPYIDSINGPRQNYPQVLVPNGYVDIIRAESVRSGGTLHGDRCLGFVTESVSDIDCLGDLARMHTAGKRARDLEEWLKARYDSLASMG